MRGTIVWSDEASWDITALGQNIADQFGLAVSGRVVQEVVNTASQLAKFPQMGKICPYNRTYRVFASKKNSIYYRLEDNVVVIAAVVDNRQGPLQIKVLLDKRNKQ